MLSEKRNEKHVVLFGEAMKTEPKKQSRPNEEGLTSPVLAYPKMTLRFSSADIRFVPPIVKIVLLIRLLLVLKVYLLLKMKNRTASDKIGPKGDGRVGLVFAKGTKSDANKLADVR